MPAVNYNFIIEQGSDFELSFQYNKEDNTPVNLTNKCVVLQWKTPNRTYQFSTAANSSSDTAGWEMSANNSGSIKFKLTASLTKDLDFDRAFYDLDILDTNSSQIKNTRLCTGTVTLLKRNLPLLSNCPNSQTGVVNEATPTVTLTNTTTSIGQTPTPPATTSIPFDDLCLPEDCMNLDIYSAVYSGGSLVIPDLATASGTVSTTDTRLIENIELAINKLQHQSPSDLIFLLSPPSGNKILLSANNKIPSYNTNFSFMFSNKASSDSYLYNISNGGICNINNKTGLINYNNESLLYSFNHLLGESVTGNWTLIAKDTDPMGSGMIDSWKLIITYIPIISNENQED